MGVRKNGTGNSLPRSRFFRDSSRVPAGTRDEPLRTSAWEAIARPGGHARGE